MKARIVWLCGVLLLSCGCASHVARCDGRLQPINVGVSPGTLRHDPDNRGLP